MEKFITFRKMVSSNGKLDAEHKGQVEEYLSCFGLAVMVPLSFVRASQLSALIARLSGSPGKIALSIASENDW